jgi:two-component system, NarL family, sensor kinase
VNDSIQKLNNQKKVYDLEAKYLAQKKELDMLSQQKIIKQKNILNYLLASGLLLLLGIITSLYFNYRSKQKLQLQHIIKLETQQQLTATEAVLKGEEQERTRLAKDLHDGLGGMLSGIKYSFNTMKGNMVMTNDNAQAFERSMDMLDSSIKEMRRVAHNMMPEALVRFGLDTALKDFCNEIQQSGALHISYQSIGLENVIIDQTISITIYRIVQELINNTMKHAVAKNAIVQITKSDNQLSVTVEDDGKGFDTAIINNPVGMGWSNITNRVEFLKGKLDIDSQRGKGTSVHIEINI